MSDWQKRFWSTTASGYVGVVARMLLGLLLFRQMFEQLTPAEFGFWALLWSLFGYGILLDFGFGFTAQKSVAEKTATGDIAGLSKLLSTILWTFIGLAAMLLVVFLTIREPFLTRMKVLPEHHAEFGSAYVVFFIGMAMMFPLGLFPEILRGLQRNDLANWVGLFATVLNFGFPSWGLHDHWSLPMLMGVSVITSALPNLIAVFIAFRHLPGISFSPRLFEWRSVRSQMGFSVAAYLITFSNMLMAKTDQLVISLVIGVASVTIYQAGFKMGEMLGMFSTQLQQLLSPAAASLYARGDDSGLRNLLLRSSRLTVLLVTPCYLLSAVYMEQLIQLLTGLDTVSNDTWWIGQTLLFTIYSSQITNSCSKRVLMMCGEEKKLLYISLVDAVGNVTLSVALAYRYGVLGVALGTMIPTVLVGWLWVVPMTVKKLKLPILDYLGYHLKGTTVALLVFSAILAALKIWAPVSSSGGFLELGWRGMLCMVPLLFLGRNVIRGMSRKRKRETDLRPLVVVRINRGERAIRNPFMNMSINLRRQTNITASIMATVVLGPAGLVSAEDQPAKATYPVEGRIVAVRPAKDPRGNPASQIRWVVELQPDEKSRKKIDSEEGIFRVYVHSLAKSFLKDEHELKGATVMINCLEKPQAAYFGKFEFKFIQGGRN